MDLRHSVFVPRFGVDIGLIQNTAKRSDRHLVFSRHDRCICALTQRSRELHMASLLADFDKTGGFKAALDLAKTERIKPPQFPLRYAARPEGWSQREVQSAVPVLREDWRAPRLLSCPDSPHRLPGTGRQSNRLPATWSRRTHVSWFDFLMSPPRRGRPSEDRSRARWDRSAFNGTYPLSSGLRVRTNPPAR